MVGTSIIERECDRCGYPRATVEVDGYGFGECASCRWDGYVSLSAIVSGLRAHGVPACLEQTGGGTGTVYVGMSTPPEDGALVPFMVGPGNFYSDSMHVEEGCLARYVWTWSNGAWDGEGEEVWSYVMGDDVEDVRTYVETLFTMATIVAWQTGGAME